MSIDLKFSGLGFISTSVLLRFGVEVVDSLYASNGAKSGFGRLSGDVWRVLYEQGGFLSVWDGDIGWLASNMSSLTLGGFIFKKGQEMMVNNGLWLAGRKSAVFLPHKSGPLKSSPLVCISHRDRSLAGILAACEHRLCAAKLKLNLSHQNLQAPEKSGGLLGTNVVRYTEMN